MQNFTVNVGENAFVILIALTFRMSCVQSGRKGAFDIV